MKTDNLNRITPSFIGQIMEYDVYIPSVYYNPISFNKRNCPIWIKINDEGMCHIITQKNDNKLQDEVTQYIIRNLPKKETLYCCKLPQSFLYKSKKMIDCDRYSMNCACMDENHTIHAYIIVGEGVVGEDNAIIIKDIQYDSYKALTLLCDYLLREENVIEHRSKIIWHSNKEKEVIKCLHFIPCETHKGFYYWQFE